MANDRSILHLDMDAFFAAVEQRDNPDLRGLPVLIGHDGARGVVAAASYEARVYGCHSAQAMVVAKRRCPNAIILPVRGQHYGQVSRQMFAVLDEFSPVVEPLSIDEAFLDMTGTQRALGEPEHVARKLKQRIVEELGLIASVGIAPNKFLAKLASDLEKPDGLTMIKAHQVDRFLAPLAVTKIWGIGRVTAKKLESYRIRTIGDLQAKSLDWLDRHLGSEAQRYWNLARGIDKRPVVADREAKSIGHEQTFGTDVNDPDEVRRVLLGHVEQVAYRLRKHGFSAKGISLKIRFGDFETITRSATLDRQTDVTEELWQTAKAIFDRWPFQPVRLIGMTAERLSKGDGQAGLFADPDRERQKRLDSVADRINDRYGKSAIKRGGKRRN